MNEIEKMGSRTFHKWQFSEKSEMFTQFKINCICSFEIIRPYLRVFWWPTNPVYRSMHIWKNLKDFVFFHCLVHVICSKHNEITLQPLPLVTMFTVHWWLYVFDFEEWSRKYVWPFIFDKEISFPGRNTSRSLHFKRRVLQKNIKIE